MQGLIDYNNKAYKKPRLLRAFAEQRQVEPSAVYRRILMECNCCDDHLPESVHLAHRCYVTEFHFGSRWMFVMIEHQHTDDPDEPEKSGTNFRTDLYSYKAVPGGWELAKERKIDTMVKNKQGDLLGPYARAENAILMDLGLKQMIARVYEEVEANG